MIDWNGQTIYADYVSLAYQWYRYLFYYSELSVWATSLAQLEEYTEEATQVEAKLCQDADSREYSIRICRGDGVVHIRHQPVVEHLVQILACDERGACSVSWGSRK